MQEMITQWIRVGNIGPINTHTYEGSETVHCQCDSSLNQCIYFRGRWDRWQSHWPKDRLWASLQAELTSPTSSWYPSDGSPHRSRCLWDFDEKERGTKKSWKYHVENNWLNLVGKPRMNTIDVHISECYSCSSGSALTGEPAWQSRFFEGTWWSPVGCDIRSDCVDFSLWTLCLELKAAPMTEFPWDASSKTSESSNVVSEAASSGLEPTVEDWPDNPLNGSCFDWLDTGKLFVVCLQGRPRGRVWIGEGGESVAAYTPKFKYRPMQKTCLLWSAVACACNWPSNCSAPQQQPSRLRKADWKFWRVGKCHVLRVF